MDRFKVATVHGERETIYHVVDTQAPQDDQPATMSTYSTSSYSNQARSCAEYAADVLNGRGYPGDPAFMAVVARCRY